MKNGNSANRGFGDGEGGGSGDEKGKEAKTMPYIEGFSRPRFHSWIRKAISTETNGRVASRYLDCFIFSWIAFNHYYASWWFDHHRHDNKKFFDEDALKECIRNNSLGEIFLKIKSRNNAIKLILPVGGGRRNDYPVPATKAPNKKYACKDLTLSEFLKICYRIRNNLIHGTKDLDTKRDQECSRFAYKNLILLLKELQKIL